MNQLEAKVTAVNIANAHANHISQLLHDFFEPLVGQQVKKVDGQLLARIKSQLPELDSAAVHQIIFRTQIPSLLEWTVKSCVHYGDHSCVYHEVNVTVGEMNGQILESVRNPIDEYTQYTVAGVKSLRRDYEKAREALDMARSDLLEFGVHDQY